MASIWTCSRSTNSASAAAAGRRWPLDASRSMGSAASAAPGGAQGQRVAATEQIGRRRDIGLALEFMMTTFMLSGRSARPAAEWARERGRRSVASTPTWRRGLGRLQLCVDDGCLPSSRRGDGVRSELTFVLRARGGQRRGARRQRDLIDGRRSSEFGRWPSCWSLSRPLGAANAATMLGACRRSGASTTMSMASAGDNSIGGGCLPLSIRRRTPRRVRCRPPRSQRTTQGARRQLVAHVGGGHSLLNAAPVDFGAERRPKRTWSWALSPSWGVASRYVDREL